MTGRTVGDNLAQAIQALRPISLSPRLDAEMILAHALKTNRAHILAHPEDTLHKRQQRKIDHLVTQRAQEVPLAYLTGVCAFYGLRLRVDDHVLVPRPETEHLVEAAIVWARGRRALHIIDVGTGSGAIAVALAVHLPTARITAIDKKKPILCLAEMNAKIHKVNERIVFERGDMLSWYNGTPAGLIAANLPYVPTAHLNRLPPHEPREALDGGKDGLLYIRRLLREAPDIVCDQSLLLLEVGFGQAGAVCALAREAFPEAAIDTIQDYAGRPRVVRIERQ